MKMLPEFDVSIGDCYGWAAIRLVAGRDRLALAGDAAKARAGAAAIAVALPDAQSLGETPNFRYTGGMLASP